MLDVKNVHEIYKLANSSYFPELLQNTELFIKENIISIENNFFVELPIEACIRYFSTFSQPLPKSVSEHGYMLDKVEMTELLLEKLVSVLETKGNLDQLKTLLPTCFDRSVIYFIFTHDQDLFEGQGGQMPYFPDSRLPKVIMYVYLCLFLTLSILTIFSILVHHIIFCRWCF